MFKIIKEMLPPDVRVARDAQDLLVECCVGMHANDKHSRKLWLYLITQMCSVVQELFFIMIFSKTLLSCKYNETRG